MSFRRHLEKELQEWKRNPRRKPLILRGARQVGKTTLIKKFAGNYSYTIFLNLEKPADLRFFDDYEDVKTLVEALYISHNIPSQKKDDTLLFIDEIQSIIKSPTSGCARKSNLQRKLIWSLRPRVK